MERLETMNPLRPTIESLLEMDLETLEKMTDVEITEYLKESLVIQPIVVAGEFVADLDAPERIVLRTSKHKKKPSNSPTDFTPKTKMGKQLAQLEQLQSMLTALGGVKKST